ncbi:MAG TPA: S8 family serine peptidase [Atopostipes sp.]|nr:S8 family serine peptidase [Atopostipes sp.]
MKKKRPILLNIILLLFLIVSSLTISTAQFHQTNHSNPAPNQNEHLTIVEKLKEFTRPSVVQAEDSTKVPGTSKAFTPNTSNLQPQWNHNMMNIGQAWADGYTGKNVSIAVLDTGFFIQHPDSQIAGGYSVFPDDPWSNDHSGHGTHIAGIISAERGSPYQGIAPDADVYGIKIYHEEDVDENGGVSTSVQSVIHGIEYALDLEVDIIVISSGLSYHDADLYNIIKEAHDQGIMIIAASGNGKSTVNYPANYSEVIAVTAIDENLNPALDIIYGQENDFSAPGVHIGGLSIPDSAYSYPYIYMSGSSQAAPHAAALAAILMEKYGERGEAIRTIMQEQALDIGDAGLFGHGLLQYVSDNEEKNNELTSLETEEDDDTRTASNDAILGSPDEELAAAEEGEEELRKPASSREADNGDTEEAEDLVAFYQTDIQEGTVLGGLEPNILDLVEDSGTLQINMQNMKSLFLTENQVSQIRHRNILLVLAREGASWSIPPANLVPGEATLRFYEDAPVGIERYEDASAGVHTVSIYQEDTRTDAYPSWMEIRYDIEDIDVENLLAYSAHYWDKDEEEWLNIDGEVTDNQVVLRTRYTTAFGFFDRDLDMANTEAANVEDEAVGEEGTVEEAGFFSTMYGKIIAGGLIFVLLLVGVGLLIKKQSTRR